MVWLKLFIVCCLFGVISAEPNAEHLDNIPFHYYDKNNQLVFTYKLNQPKSEFNASMCDPKGKYAIITHGHGQDCEEKWLLRLVKNLNKFRGGCVICMDYSKYSKMDYTTVVGNFDDIPQVLAKKLYFLNQKGFDASTAYLFGFSLGGHIMLLGAEQYVLHKVANIDICDLAGPFFNPRNYRSVAKNVQCVHTSSEYGTSDYTGCHQNWRLGRCGTLQVGAKERPYRSHGMCPIFYNLAFEHDYLAAENVERCSTFGNVAEYPENFKMGYTESQTRKENVTGQLFAETTKYYPFTVDGVIRTTDFDFYETAISEYFSSDPAVNQQIKLKTSPFNYEYEEDEFADYGWNKAEPLL